MSTFDKVSKIIALFVLIVFTLSCIVVLGITFIYQKAFPIQLYITMAFALPIGWCSYLDKAKKD